MKEKLEIIKQRINIYSYLFLLFGFSFLVIIIAYLINRNSILSVLFVDGNDYFMDFFNVVGFSTLKNPYISEYYLNKFYGGSSYFPISIIILYPFNIFANFKDSVSGLVMNSAPWRHSIFELRTPFVITAFLVIYFVALIACVYLMFKLVKPSNNKQKICIILLTCFSAPALFNFHRGNILILALLAIIFFLNYYKSENKALKYLALFSYSFATVVKLYPIILGMVLLKEKKIRDLILSAIVTIILAFVPFLLYPNPSDTILMFFDNLIFSLAGASDNQILGILKISFIVLFFSVNIVFYFLESTKWKNSFFLFNAMTIVFLFSHQYMVYFLIIPFAILLQEKEYTKIKLASLILLSIVMVPFPSPFISGSITMKYFISIILLMLNSFILIADSYFNFSKS